jgi:hypothetical protein
MRNHGDIYEYPFEVPKESQLSIIGSVFGPSKMIYTEDESILSPAYGDWEEETHRDADETYAERRPIDLWKLGLAKRTAWNFEEEYRFRILVRASAVEYKYYMVLRGHPKPANSGHLKTGQR